MIDEQHVREMLHRRANAVPTLDVDAPRAARRARRRLLANGAIVVLAVAAIALATIAGIDAIRSAPVPASEPTQPEGLGIFSPVAGRIVFGDDGSDLGYGPGLWAVDPNGIPDTTRDTATGSNVSDDVASALVRLGPGNMIPLGWSSDGTELLFKRGTYSRPDGGDMFPEEYLFVLHSDGSETQLNTEPMYFAEHSATISPDGSRVVFAAQADHLGLYAVDTRGGQPVPLPYPSDGLPGSPTFSPDGSQIAYLVWGDSPAGNPSEEHVWVANADGSEAHEILADDRTSLSCEGLQWSPAGDRLACGGRGLDGNDGRDAIYTFAPDGSNFTKVIDGGTSPYWSPDGSQVAYEIPCDMRPNGPCPVGSDLRAEYDPQPGEDPAGLAIADADGSNVRPFGFATSGPWNPAASTTEEPAPSPAPATETVPPSDGTFVRTNDEVLDFTGGAGQGQEGDLIAVNPRTGEERVLVENLTGVRAARWSADGRWVAYEAKGANGIGLWVVGASRESRQVATGTLAWMWSPTGGALAVVEPSEIGYEGATLSVIDPTTGDSTDAGTIPTPDRIDDVTSAPVWSPDGTRFVFGARGGAIYSIDVRSGASSLLVRLPGKDLDSVDMIAWSPDGTHIAVMNDLVPGEGRLYVMNADGSDVRVLLPDNSNSMTGLAWSPDGTRLAYTDESCMIWTASMDGSAPTEIGRPLTASCSSKLDLTWSPDGTQIASRSAGDGWLHLSAIDAQGSGKVEAIDDLIYRSWDGGWFGLAG